MPRDASVTMRLFMVDVRAIHSNKLICTQGPFSEAKAQRVSNQVTHIESRYYGDIRRATEEELKR